MDRDRALYEPKGWPMTQPKSPKVGKPLDLTDAELDHAAEVTAVDIAAAKALWRHHAPPALAALLDAEQGAH